MLLLLITQPEKENERIHIDGKLLLIDQIIPDQTLETTNRIKSAESHIAHS